MKVLHITSHLEVGGVPRAVLSLARGLRARGDDVIIASGGGAWVASAEALGASHWHAPLATSAEFSPQVFAAARGLAARVRREPVDLLHGHTRVGQVVAARLSRRLRIPYVVTWHGFFRPNLGRRLWPCTGDAAIAISEPVRQHLIQTFRVPSRRVHLVPHGIDPAPFESPIDPSAQQALRAQLGLQGTERIVGTMARLVPSKGVDQLIRSLPRIRERLPQARLVILGDGAARGDLERLAVSLGVGEAVRFAGALTESRAALSLMEVFVFIPADREGFGLSLLEAMASARPIVAIRRGGGAPWVLEQSHAGTLIEPDDPRALAEAVCRWLDDPEAARREGERGRAVVKAQFSYDHMIDRTRAVYQELLNGRPAR